ncbi:MAG: hypothetical protein VXZ39_10780, partial [Planctomycetota bacterium]|nr:hypothetical protein [Planctomycetota bacterium]
MTTHLRSAVAALMALVALAACKSGPIASTSTLSASEVPAAIERASNASIPLASSAELAEIV